jgi:prepilin-type N-terminal cleavage/methylation domain-containing protein
MMSRGGFTLVEVITAIVIMSAMMVAVIGFVDYGAGIWRRGNTQMSAKNYMRLTFDTLKEDLNMAHTVSVPVVGATVASVSYKVGTAREFAVLVNDGTLHRVSWPISGAKVERRQVLARKVDKFVVNRVSTWTLRIGLTIYDDFDEDGMGGGVREIVSSETMVITVPGLS